MQFSHKSAYNKLIQEQTMTFTIQEAIKTGFEEVFEFTDGYYTYKRCKKSLTALNRILVASFKYVYRDVMDLEDKEPWDEKDIISLDSDVYVVTRKGDLVKIMTSSYGFISKVKK